MGMVVYVTWQGSFEDTKGVIIWSCKSKDRQCNGQEKDFGYQASYIGTAIQNWALTFIFLVSDFGYQASYLGTAKMSINYIIKVVLIILLFCKCNIPGYDATRMSFDWIHSYFTCLVML